MRAKQLYQLSANRTIGYFAEIPTEKPSKPYWILITKYPIAETFDLDFDEQQKVLRRHGYEVPTMLEAAIAVVAAKRVGNISIYPHESLFTRCKEEFRYMRVTIGSDLCVPFSTHLDDSIALIGMAGVRRFF